MTPLMKTSASLLLLMPMASCLSAWADEPVMDGKWRGSGTASVSYASGNTRSASLALAADGARQTSDDKLSLYAQALGSRAESTANGVTSTNTTANQWKAGTRYDRNITDTTFGFGGLDFSHDQIQLLSLRSIVSAGAGYHLIKTAETQWDLLGGASYRADQYANPGVAIGNQTRTTFSAPALLLGEESSSKLTASTSLKQRLVVSPNLSSDRGYLATFDTGLTVAMSETLSLKVSLQDRYNSLSQVPVKKNDLLFLTGINVKFGG